MAIKLIKACKELNIGMSTAIEFCAKQGKEIAVDPNTRIDDDLYLLLAKEFNKDMALKLEAERQAQARQERDIPETISVDKPKEPAHIETEVPKPKVLGKIDLEAEKKAKEEARRKAAEEAAAAAKKAAEEKARAEIAEAAAKEAEARKAAAEAQRAREEEKRQKAEVFKLDKPVLKNQPKVVGKIDLSAINQATHPGKKSKEEKKKEREERMQQQQQQNAQNADPTVRGRVG